MCYRDLSLVEFLVCVRVREREKECVCVRERERERVYERGGERE